MTEEELENKYLEFGRTVIDIIRKNWCPERSKREDDNPCKGSTLEEFLKNEGILDECTKIANERLSMRCSELYGNIERDK